jgi:hypothetical protein
VNKDYAAFAHDLTIMEEMAANMALYLDSNVVDWTIPQANMPRLTIGGYLMRQQRLLAFQDILSAEDQVRLIEAISQFNADLKERVVRFEVRAHQELHMRIAEWIGVLRDLKRYSAVEVNYYAGIVDTRVVMKELLDKLQTPPYKLDEGVLDEVLTIDRMLKNRFTEGEFVWDPMWEAAYPRSEYWWLYGTPD